MSYLWEVLFMAGAAALGYRAWQYLGVLLEHAKRHLLPDKDDR